jgi:hypothetical protein
MRLLNTRVLPIQIQRQKLNILDKLRNNKSFRKIRVECTVDTNGCVE